MNGSETPAAGAYTTDGAGTRKATRRQTLLRLGWCLCTGLFLLLVRMWFVFDLRLIYGALYLPLALGSALPACWVVGRWIIRRIPQKLVQAILSALLALGLCLACLYGSVAWLFAAVNDETDFFSSPDKAHTVVVMQKNLFGLKMVDAAPVRYGIFFDFDNSVYVDLPRTVLITGISTQWYEQEAVEITLHLDNLIDGNGVTGEEVLFLPL